MRREEVFRSRSERKHVRDRQYAVLGIAPERVVLCTLLLRGEQWKIIALTEAMTDRKEPPIRLSAGPEIEQKQAIIDMAFPGASVHSTHTWTVLEMKNYLKQAGYTHIQWLED